MVRGTMLWRLALCALFVVVFVRSAWLSDDAYISFRVVENLVNGHGLRWNVAERVEVFTNPLWVLVMALLRALTGEVYLTSLALSAACSAAAFALVLFRGAHPRGALLAGCALIFSRAFVDYTSSGLENPLTYLLLAAFVTRFLDGGPCDARRLRTLALLGALLLVNRMDTLLVFGPALALAFFTTPSGRWRAAAVGFLPFVAWKLFALVYFGFLVPNTAYAKLGTGIDAPELVRQGLRYLEDSMLTDPVTLPCIAAAVALACVRARSRNLALAAGVLLHLSYVVWVGGDFMSGRFLTAPFLVAALLLSRAPWTERTGFFAASLAAVGLLGFLGPRPTVLSGADATLEGARYGPHPSIVDERRFYFEGTSLSGWLRGELRPDAPMRAQGLAARESGKRVIQGSNMGFGGFYAGPDVHLVDVHGLTDPLLARLPALYEPEWRIGHFKRRLPPGYMETLREGENRIEDRDLARYWERLELVTRGDLFAPERWRAIAGLALGRYDGWLESERDPFRGIMTIEAQALAGPATSDSGHGIVRTGLLVGWPEPRFDRRLEVTVQANDSHELLFFRGGELLGKRRVPYRNASDQRVDHVVPVPRAALERGYDRVIVMRVRGRGGCRVFRLVPAADE